MTAPNLISRIRRTSWIERCDAVQALWRVVCVRVLLATVGIRRAQRLLLRPRADAPAAADPVLWDRRVVAIRRAAARVPGAVCLARSLTLCWWMRAAGLQPELRMGVRLGNRGAEGHAWAVLAGKALDESDEVIATYQQIAW
jgi:Transglutaminase-like superfamily